MKTTHYPTYELTPAEIDIFLNYIAGTISAKEAASALELPSRQHLYGMSASILRQLWRDGIIGRINHPRAPNDSTTKI